MTATLIGYFFITLNPRDDTRRMKMLTGLALCYNCDGSCLSVELSPGSVLTPQPPQPHAPASLYKENIHVPPATADPGL